MKPTLMRQAPPQIKALSTMLDHGPAFGAPIPWFVGLSPVTERPDFRCVKAGAVEQALRERRCWICGQVERFQRGSVRSFLIGPMCVINRITSEPPSHFRCAVWAAKACPFLATPRRKRRPIDAELEAVTDKPVGAHEPGNPGGVVIWSTGQWRRNEHRLIELGEPYRIDVFTEGRRATAAEAHALFDDGAARLAKAAALESAAAFAACIVMTDEARRLIPHRSVGTAWPQIAVKPGSLIRRAS